VWVCHPSNSQGFYRFRTSPEIVENPRSHIAEVRILHPLSLRFVESRERLFTPLKIVENPRSHIAEVGILHPLFLRFVESRERLFTPLKIVENPRSHIAEVGILQPLAYTFSDDSEAGISITRQEVPEDQCDNLSSVEHTSLNALDDLGKAHSTFNLIKSSTSDCVFCAFFCMY